MQAHKFNQKKLVAWSIITKSVQINYLTLFGIFRLSSWAVMPARVA